MNINVSIHDFSPLFRSPEFLFRGLSQTGVSGVEIVLGVKSRWSVSYLRRLSEKYSLPIASVHQPPWAGLGYVFDEGAFLVAKQLGISKMTCHPLPNVSFNHPRMIRYLEHLARMQERTGIRVLLENQPHTYQTSLLSIVFAPTPDTGDLSTVARIAKKYGFGVTVDIDHLQLSEPHKHRLFKDAFSQIENVHLSSFSPGKNHLPLDRGEFKSQAFSHFLQKNRYKGLLTLEVNSPRLLTFTDYDFDVIKKSVSCMLS